MLAEPDGLALNDEGHPDRLGAGSCPLVGHPEPPLLGSGGDGQPSRDFAGLAQGGLEPLADATQGGRFLPGDLALDPGLRVAGTGHRRYSPTATDSISHCCRSRNRVTACRVRASASASRLMRSGTMYRTSG